MPPDDWTMAPPMLLTVGSGKFGTPCCRMHCACASAACLALATTAGLWGRERRKNARHEVTVSGLRQQLHVVSGERDEAVREQGIATNQTRGQVLDDMLREGYKIHVEPPDDRGH